MSLIPTHWYYNTETGQLTQGNNVENLGNNLLGGLGWHELNIPGSATQAQAAAEAKKEFPTGKAPTTAGITPSRVVSTAASEAGVTNYLGFLQGLTSANLWVRVAKVAIGGALLLIGLAKMTGFDNAVSDVAKKAPLII